MAKSSSSLLPSPFSLFWSMLSSVLVAAEGEKYPAVALGFPSARLGVYIGALELGLVLHSGMDAEG